jgi:hypothetical protein
VGEANVEAIVKRKIGRPPRLDTYAMPWEKAAIAKQVHDILAAAEAPSIDAATRLTLQRLLYRREKFGGGDGRGHVTLLIRTILESAGNENALVEPIVSAVSQCMRPEWTRLGLTWIETFDRIHLTEILQTMRGLDLFTENSIGNYFVIVLRNKLAAILEPLVSKPAPMRAKRTTAIAKRRPTDQPARRMAA